MDDAFRNHPRYPQLLEAVLEWLVEAGVNGLTK
jgi:hypothetical protein